MAEKKKNQILEEQRRARQEFIDLKKMQHGEMQAPPKPSEIAFVPKTPKEKISNFWFQYKWHTISIIAITIILAVLITQCATRTKYDLEVVYFTYTPVLDDQTAAVADYIKEFADDLNGDGEVNVQVINCSVSKSDGNRQYEYTMMTKLQALIAGDQNALLFITDNDSYEYLNNISKDESIFTAEPHKFGKDFYEKTKLPSLGELKDGLQISCRRLTGTTLEKNKGAAKAYKEATKILDAISDLN